jgi:RHS repeat-associated protein
LQGVGGIGGLLARSAHPTLTYQASTHALYHADGNGNVTALVNPQQAIVARYHYDPYGNLLAKSGSLADANLYRFSSKEAHTPSGLVYYLYRYYAPELKRWLNRDPIQETGGINLFLFLTNNPVNYIDAFGNLAIPIPAICVLNPAACVVVGVGLAAWWIWYNMVMSGAVCITWNISVPQVSPCSFGSGVIIDLTLDLWHCTYWCGNLLIVEVQTGGCLNTPMWAGSE